MFVNKIPNYTLITNEIPKIGHLPAKILSIDKYLNNYLCHLPSLEDCAETSFVTNVHLKTI